MGLNFFIFKLILDSLDYEMSKLSKINTRDQLVEKKRLELVIRSLKAAYVRLKVMQQPAFSLLTYSYLLLILLFDTYS
ncbi:hypothetical protein FCV58_08445 [Vibrio sp. F13]|nr:hypothetical protein BCU05_07280 [Vibrio sp. 10N.261.54.C3]PMN95471.1 hypothetical protein BCT21_03925 [Vibrio sp. 10N.222.55.F9]TKF40123.1 hypothetical protein FCV57_11365 [Vibrio sp. F13]TKF67225.1 hypothetical protein FCV58_08445 [Vibrio sp. F13]